MNQEKFIEIQAAIFEVGLLFGKQQQPTEQMVNAYAKALLNYTPQQITYAFNQVILSGSAFFPSLAEVLKHLRPQEEKKEDLAPIIANEIISFVRLHHFDLEKNYFHTLSETAQAVIEANGGTKSIRDSDNPETMKAQLERLVKGVLASKTTEVKNKQLEKIGIVIPINRPGVKALDYSAFLTMEER